MIKARKDENGEIKRYVEMPKYWANYAGNFHEQSDEVHRQFGFYPVVFPKYNPQLQERGEIYFDEEQQVFTYTVTDKAFDLDEIKARLIHDLHDTINEISQLVSAIKNVYDPLRTNPENIPEEVKTLIGMILPLRERAKSEIEALKLPADATNDNENALKYKVRGPEVQAFIDQLKTFL